MNEGLQRSWARPESIAIATDLTDLGHLLPQAKAQAGVSGAKLWLVHVIPPQKYVPRSSGAYPFVPKEKIYRDVEAVLEKEATNLAKEGFRCAYEIRRFYEAEEIAAFIREKKIDRLIVATSGKGKLGKFFLGSVAEALIRTVEIPVCTIGPHVDFSAKANSHNILYATSLRRETEMGLRFAAALAAASKSQLTVLHVVEAGYSHPAEVADVKFRMDSLMGEIFGSGAAPDVLIAIGDPAKIILREAGRLKPALLVLGAVPSGNLTAMVRTGVAYDVITNAYCPVLTLRDRSSMQSEKRESLRDEGQLQTRLS